MIEKNVCTENLDLAKDIVMNYLLQQCAGNDKYSQLEYIYHYKSIKDDELSFKTNFNVPTKGNYFEFKIDLVRDTRLEKFPEEIDIFNFINFVNQIKN
jgi:hypothetical protein